MPYHGSAANIIHLRNNPYSLERYDEKHSSPLSHGAAPPGPPFAEHSQQGWKAAAGENVTAAAQREEPPTEPLGSSASSSTKSPLHATTAMSPLLSRAFGVGSPRLF